VSVFRDNVVLTDIRGVEWRKGPDYQETDTNIDTYFQFQSSKGELLPYKILLDLYGYDCPEEESNCMNGRDE
jgi:hypothetical protein